MRFRWIWSCLDKGVYLVSQTVSLPLPTNNPMVLVIQIIVFTRRLFSVATKYNLNVNAGFYNIRYFIYNCLFFRIVQTLPKICCWTILALLRYTWTKTWRTVTEVLTEELSEWQIYLFLSFKGLKQYEKEFLLKRKYKKKCIVSGRDKTFRFSYLEKSQFV